MTQLRKTEHYEVTTLEELLDAFTYASWVRVHPGLTIISLRLHTSEKIPGNARLIIPNPTATTRTFLPVNDVRTGFPIEVVFNSVEEVIALSDKSMDKEAWLSARTDDVNYILRETHRVHVTKCFLSSVRIERQLSGPLTSTVLTHETYVRPPALKRQKVLKNAAKTRVFDVKTSKSR